MIRTLEAEIDENGNVRLLERLRLPSVRRAFVTILDSDSDAAANDTGDAILLSEMALAEDWNRPEEDQAWSHLQPVP